MVEHFEILVPIVSGLLTVAGAFGGIKVALNGTVKRVERIENKLDVAIKAEGDLQANWCALRADMDGALSRIDRVQGTVNEIQREQHDLTRRLAHLEGALGDR